MRISLRVTSVCLFLMVIVISGVVQGKGIVKEEPESFTIVTEGLGFKIMKATGRLPSGGGIYVINGEDGEDLVPERVYRLDRMLRTLRVTWDTKEDIPAVARLLEGARVRL